MKNTTRKVFGFDQSTRKSGISIWNVNTKELIGTKLLEADSQVQMIEKLREFFFQEAKAGDYIILEDVFLGKNPKTAIQLARVQGSIQTFASIIDLGYYFFKPSEWKSHFGLKGGRTKEKELSLKLVEDKYNIKCETDDVADAILLGQYFLDIAKIKE